MNINNSPKYRSYSCLQCYMVSSIFFVFYYYYNNMKITLEIGKLARYAMAIPFLVLKFAVVSLLFNPNAYSLSCWQYSRSNVLSAFRIKTRARVPDRTWLKWKGSNIYANIWQMNSRRNFQYMFQISSLVVTRPIYNWKFYTCLLFKHLLVLELNFGKLPHVKRGYACAK